MQGAFLLLLSEKLMATPVDVDNGFFVGFRKHHSEEQLIELAAVRTKTSARASTVLSI
jgi:hypothetical protein